ncbi:MAG: ATP-binding protein [Desulfovibrio sp.]
MGREFHASITIDADLSHLRKSAELVADCAKSLGLDSAQKQALDMSASEGLANAIKHSSATGSEGIVFEIKATGNQIVITISDNGPGFDFDKIPSPEFTTDIPEVKDHGYGIHIIRELTDDVRYEMHDGRNILTMIWDIKEG